jgi:hypothetical protein
MLSDQESEFFHAVPLPVTLKRRAAVNGKVWICWQRMLEF